MLRRIWKALDEFPACNGPPGVEKGYAPCNIMWATVGALIVLYPVVAIWLSE